MGMVVSVCMEPMKRRRAEKDLDDKVAAALRERARSQHRQRIFRSVNSITMRLPRFKDGLRDIKDVFDQYGSN
jgi:calcium-binding protein CML